VGASVEADVEPPLFEEDSFLLEELQPLPSAARPAAAIAAARTCLSRPVICASSASEAVGSSTPSRGLR
jgi:hypothetical protein